MSSEKRPSDFAERLRRIEESQKQPRTAVPPQVRKDLTYDNSGGAEDNRLRNGIIWSVIAAGMATGGYFAAQAVPPEMSARLAGIGGVFSSGATVQSMDGSDDDVPVYVAQTGMRGANLQSPAVASNLPDPVTLSELVTGAVQPDDTVKIGRIIPFDRNDECNLRRPMDGEQVVNVRLERGALPVPVRAFSDEALVAQLTRNVSAVTQDGRAYDWDAQVRAPMTGVDVFLTDTSAPIYLVLQSLNDGIIWNIQTAPDVTLAHVAIVASGFSGLVSPPDDAGFEALLVSDFVPRHALGADDRPRPCMIRPWREPQPDWTIADNALYGKQLDSFTTGYAAYNAWYMGTLGVDAGTNLVAPETAAHVHVGPMPAAPFPYQAMDGRDVHLMRTDHLINGDPIARQAALDALHGRVLRDAIGGDVALLQTAGVATPVPMAAAAEVERFTLPRDPLQYLRDRTSLRDIFSTEISAPGRMITISETRPIEDILSPGEALPDPSRIPLYAAARAPVWMARHCEDVIAAFAVSCDLTASAAQVLDDGRIEMTATFGYIPAATLGDPRNVGNAAFVTADAMLVDTSRLLPPFDAENRRAAMRKAQVICDRLREQFGTCVVSDLQLVAKDLWPTDLERLPPGTEQQRLSASVSVTVYADKTWTNEQQLHDIVQALASAE